MLAPLMEHTIDEEIVYYAGDDEVDGDYVHDVDNGDNSDHDQLTVNDYIINDTVFGALPINNQTVLYLVDDTVHNETSSIGSAGQTTTDDIVDKRKITG
ncbi:hypothetical protein NDU88_010188 [Pleurodeles waltl]|uniref:Uncharacterized protein n=1 Tax=Pleurodeles waltl TaxID=8319 RepID=A0AAV7PU75_PLEWA|nr:hypothetical protein NDU88_010188 [Pleurodeles waltl]